MIVINSLLQMINWFQSNITKVLKAGHPMLRSKSTPVQDFLKIEPIISQMNSTLRYKKSQILGLAAPQLGHPFRIIGYRMENDSKPTYLINPVIEKIGVEKAEYESCISVPKYSCLVKRHSKIKVNALGLNQGKLEFEANGLLARVIQHEMDHLDGILLTDRMVPKSLRHDDYIGEFEIITKK